MMAASAARKRPLSPAETPAVAHDGMRLFAFKGDLLDAVAPGYRTGAWQTREDWAARLRKRIRPRRKLQTTSRNKFATR